jgi:hypothetical protein
MASLDYTQDFVSDIVGSCNNFVMQLSVFDPSQPQSLVTRITYAESNRRLAKTDNSSGTLDCKALALV